MPASGHCYHSHPHLFHQLLRCATVSRRREGGNFASKTLFRELKLYLQCPVLILGSSQSGTSALLWSRKALVIETNTKGPNRSAIAPKGDIRRHERHVGQAPEADMVCGLIDHLQIGHFEGLVPEGFLGSIKAKPKIRAPCSSSESSLTPDRRAPSKRQEWSASVLVAVSAKVSNASPRRVELNGTALPSGVKAEGFSSR
jgi:hypothetical protein